MFKLGDIKTDSININIEEISNTDIFLIIIFLLIVIQLIVALIVIFPRIRKAFLTRERSKPKKNLNSIIESSEAIMVLKKNKKGALIIFEKSDSTDNEIIDGKLLDAVISKELIINIFEGSKTPLHDGAIVIRNNRITYAGAFITSLAKLDREKIGQVKKKNLSSHGTRHRSALSVTSKLDCVALILSEETNKISVISKNRIEAPSNIGEMVEVLSDLLIGENKYK